MCHVIVTCPVELSSEEKKEFQTKKRLEIRKTKTNPIIQFVYGNNRKSKKQKINYFKKHPRAIDWETRLN